MMFLEKKKLNDFKVALIMMKLNVKKGWEEFE